MKEWRRASAECAARALRDVQSEAALVAAAARRGLEGRLADAETELATLRGRAAIMREEAAISYENKRERDAAAHRHEVERLTAELKEASSWARELQSEHNAYLRQLLLERRTKNGLLEDAGLQLVPPPPPADSPPPPALNWDSEGAASLLDAIRGHHLSRKRYPRTCGDIQLGKSALAFCTETPGVLEIAVGRVKAEQTAKRRRVSDDDAGSTPPPPAEEGGAAASGTVDD